ncbi:MAG TPA: SDR family oxidoreductase, partial [Thermoanaerobaculia bacterium]|nr:SDR family oxidoreductase [Thermoanaerobaculia bacterium]
VFAGVMNCHYEALGAHAWARGERTGAYSAYWSIANRVSYHFDLRGPSLAVDTACSSSLTAIHLACESIRRGESRVALAGGVNLVLHPMHVARLTAKNMLAADGRCKTFGAGADGFVDGEGVGVVVLKRLADAIRDRDVIHGVIKASAINAGGKTSGYTVPNPNAQTDVIAESLRRANIDPSTISYVEAHGTGTALGDPIEVRALAQAWGSRNGHACAIGSVKSNIGHLESAAGIAGLTKVLLQFRHRMLAPTLHAETLNPHIDFDETPFVVQRALAPWTASGPLRASVSSFGAGGANAHVIVEAFGAPPRAATTSPQWLTLSAQSEDRLRARAAQLANALEQRAPNLADVAWTLQHGRESMREQLAFVAPNHDDAIATLRRFAETGVRPHQDGNAPLPADGMRVSLPSYPFAGDRYWIRIPEDGGTTLAFRANAPVADGAFGDPRTFVETTLAQLADAARRGERISRRTSRDPLEAALDGWRRTLAIEMPHLNIETDDVTFDEVPLAPQRSAFVKNGVYVISGGGGAIGRLVAQHLIANYDARVVLLGRSGGDGVTRCDVTNFAEVKAAIDDVRRHFGKIDGVIHAAGVIDDAPALSRMPQDSWRVIAPKVAGAIHLDAATREDNLSLFVCFSSLVSFFGNAGQADYAFASRFLHHFAERRGDNTRVLHWPLWESGGMRMPAERVHALRQSTGLEPMPTPAALDALESALVSDARQLLIAYGDAEKIRELMRPRAAAVIATSDANVANIITETLGLPLGALERDVNFQHYGVDSVWMLRILAKLEPHYGPLPKTLLFECTTLAELESYLAQKTTAVAFTPKPAQSANEPIAIIGVAGRYPDADDLEEFWDNLRSGRDCIREIPADRWSIDAYPAPDPRTPERRYSRWGGFLRHVDRFDPRFFNLLPREARDMDPQERLFLETAWEAVENAGYSPESIAASCANEVGVFAGVMWGEYQLVGANAARPLNASFAAVANRVSWMFDWHAPSMAIDTMCSSSLTSIHLACESLRRGECRMALAGGVNVSIHPHKYLLIGQHQFASSDGRCRSFGDGGDGYVPGEGTGAVLLKPLSAAISDGDFIHGVILGSALNHGGQSSGYTVPNPKAQTAVIQRALAAAGVAPASIDYIETHGTGTPLGDPVEIRGLAEALGGIGACPIGSVKSNVGHLESAAGIAAITKVLLQFRHRTLAPSLHAERLNTNIDWNAVPFFVQRDAAPWNGRRACVSSFGAGGANAHLVIDAPPPVAPSRDDEREQIIVLSARNRERLTEMVRRLIARFPVAPLADVAFTLQTGRKAMEERLAIVARTREEWIERANAWLRGETREGIFAGRAQRNAVDTNAPLAERWVRGERIDWTAQHPAPRRRVPLPSYPFARERYWPEVEEQRPSATTLTQDLDIVRDHRVRGAAVVAGVVQLEFVRAATNGALHDITWVRPLVVADKPIDVRVEIDGDRFELRTDVVHATGRIAAVDDQTIIEDVDAIRRRCTNVVPAARVYESFTRRGLEYGSLFRSVIEIASGDGEALATLHADAHAGMLDGALQTIAALAGFDSDELPLPFALGAFIVRRELPRRAYAWARRAPNGYRVDVLDERGNVCATFDDFAVRVTAESLTYLRPVWRLCSAGGRTCTGHVVGDGPLAAQLRERFPDATDDHSILFVAGADAERNLLALLELAPRARELTVITNANTPLGSESIGFALAMAKELPQLDVACVEVSPQPDGTLRDDDLR